MIKKGNLIALTTVAVLSIGIYDMAGHSRSSQDAGTLVIQNDLSDLGTHSDVVSENRVQVAGNAPCNPEREVCEK